jgi:hypothetical protein
VYFILVDPSEVAKKFLLFHKNCEKVVTCQPLQSNERMPDTAQPVLITLE